MNSVDLSVYEDKLSEDLLRALLDDVERAPDPKDRIEGLQQAYKRVTRRLDEIENEIVEEKALGTGQTGDLRTEEEACQTLRRILKREIRQAVGHFKSLYLSADEEQILASFPQLREAADADSFRPVVRAQVVFKGKERTEDQSKRGTHIPDEVRRWAVRAWKHYRNHEGTGSEEAKRKVLKLARGNDFALTHSWLGSLLTDYRAGRVDLSG